VKGNYVNNCALLLLLGVGALMAQEAKPSRSPSSGTQGSQVTRPAGPETGNDIKAIRALSDAFLKAYNSKDAKALGALFTEGAEIENEKGEVTRGRSAIAERFSQLFAEGQGGKIKVSDETVRFLSPSLAIEEGTASVTEADEEKPETTRYSVIYVKQDGRWLHARIRDEEAEEVSPHEHLKDLEWMLGEWVNESDDAIVTTTCTWSDDGSFLLRQFDVKIEGVIALKGTQRIGWDPHLSQFRTWVFDAEGGFGEGVFSRAGEQWIVKATGVRSDGKAASATNIITPLSKDRIGWEAADRTIGGVAVPGIDQFVLVRKPPQPNK
jgi:uncharacterized protein (TIGR02246 family)